MNYKGSSGSQLKSAASLTSHSHLTATYIQCTLLIKVVYLSCQCSAHSFTACLLNHGSPEGYAVCCSQGAQPATVWLTDAEDQYIGGLGHFIGFVDNKKKKMAAMRRGRPRGAGVDVQK